MKPKTASKSYDEAIPKFLHGRPKAFDDHCMKRVINASIYSEKDVMEDGECYRVKPESNPVALHRVDLNIPSCDCHDFQNHYMPCKHILAIVLICNAWEEINCAYVNSKYFTINEDFLDLVNSESEQLKDKKNDESSCDLDPLSVRISDVTSANRKKANMVINALKIYINGTDSNDAITHAIELLTECQQTLYMEHGDISPFRRSNQNKGPLIIPSTFLKRKQKKWRKSWPKNVKGNSIK